MQEVVKIISQNDKFEELARSGDNSAIIHLAINSFNGENNFKQDLHQAEYWLQRAVKLHLPKADIAQVYLASMYEKGVIVEQSHDKAFELYRIAADRYNKEAISKVAEYYYNGIAVHKDLLRAFTIWRENDDFSMLDKYFVDDNYELHRNIAKKYCDNSYHKDGAEYWNALWWLKLDYEHNKNADSAFDCAMEYLLQRDYENAVLWLQRAEHLGRKSAIRVMGDIYYQVYGQHFMAAKFYAKAAIHGDKKAAGQLSRNIFSGVMKVSLIYLLAGIIVHTLYIGEAFFWNTYITEKNHQYAEYVSELKSFQNEFQQKGLRAANQCDVYYGFLHDAEVVVADVKDKSELSGKVDKQIKSMDNFFTFSQILQETYTRKDSQVPDTLDLAYQQTFEDMQEAEYVKRVGEYQEAAMERMIYGAYEQRLNEAHEVQIRQNIKEKEKANQ